MFNWGLLFDSYYVPTMSGCSSDVLRWQPKNNRRNGRSTIQTGVKYSRVNNRNSNLYDIYNFPYSKWETDTSQTNHFRYRELIYAAHLNFSSTFGKIKYSAGVRVESTQSESISITTNESFIRTPLYYFKPVFLFIGSIYH